MTSRPTLAGWLFRPVPIFLTKNLEASFKYKVSIAAILDGFHVIIISLVIVWHIASGDVLWWRACHYCKVNNLACSLLELKSQPYLTFCLQHQGKKIVWVNQKYIIEDYSTSVISFSFYFFPLLFLLFIWQENPNTFLLAFILRHSGILLQVPLAVHSALSSPISA